MTPFADYVSTEYIRRGLQAQFDKALDGIKSATSASRTVLDSQLTTRPGDYS
jgi:hypothetical protein